MIKTLVNTHKFDSAMSKIAKALMMPKYHAHILSELENGVQRLMILRPDLSPELIKKKIGEKTQEIISKSPYAKGLETLKAVSEGLYNLACAGEPMPWEVDK